MSDYMGGDAQVGCRSNMHTTPVAKQRPSLWTFSKLRSAPETGLGTTASGEAPGDAVPGAAPAGGAAARAAAGRWARLLGSVSLHHPGAT